MARAARGWWSVVLGCAPSFETEPLDMGWGSAEPGRARCEAPLAPHDVQGSASESPLSGRKVDVAGVATLVRAGPTQPTGFFLQSISPDADPRTSEALFVALPAWAAPEAGARVRVRGVVTEAQGLTRLEAVERLEECGPAPLDAAPLDVQGLADAEAWEGMWVRARAKWTVLDATDARDGGSLGVSASGRIYAAGHELASDAAPQLWTIEPAARGSAPQGSAGMTPAPPEAGAPLRLGASLEEIVGALQVEGGRRRLHVPEPLAWPSNPPAPPERPHPTSLRVVALNLDNYFIDLNGRGARTAAALELQRDKLAAALEQLDPDLLALSELENRGSQSLTHLLDGLYALADERQYDFWEATPPSTAPLRVAIAYRPARVEALGEARFDLAPAFRRAPLFQQFEHAGGRFTLGVVHLTSKRCNGLPESEPGLGCGQEARSSEAEQLTTIVRALARSDPLAPLLLVGDFNADSLEAPLIALREAGLVDLLAALPAAERYSYVYEGRASLLDHALAASALAPHARAALWHVNADEPLAAQGAERHALAVDPRRCSDHDPVVVDLTRRHRPIGH